MGKPIVCAECQRIVVVKSGSGSCPDCGSPTGETKKTAQSALTRQGRIGTDQNSMSEDLQWSLILIGIGIIFLVWGIVSPETSIRKKWSSGSGTPISWIGGFSLAVGVIWAFCLAVFSKKD